MIEELQELGYKPTIVRVQRESGTQVIVGVEGIAEPLLRNIGETHGIVGCTRPMCGGLGWFLIIQQGAI